MPCAPVLLSSCVLARRAPRRESRYRQLLFHKGKPLKTAFKKWREEVHMRHKCKGMVALWDKYIASGGAKTTCYSSMSLQGKDFQNRKLLNASFDGSNCACANFSGSKVVRGSFNKANLSEAEFAEANLKNAKMMRTRLSGSNLYGAKLQGVNFDGAVLESTAARPRTHPGHSRAL